jgi:hypothetical protein
MSPGQYSLLTSSTSVVSAGALAAGLATGFTPAKLVIGDRCRDSNGPRLRRGQSSYAERRWWRWRGSASANAVTRFRVVEPRSPWIASKNPHAAICSPGGARSRAWPSVRSPWDRGKHWREEVNSPLSLLSLDSLRQSVTRGTPQGQSQWIADLTSANGMESTVRSRGRPRKLISQE